MEVSNKLPVPREIKIGKKGNQPFAISKGSVSEVHAVVAIDAYGNWYIEDKSKNGTYILDEEHGEWMEVKNRTRIYTDTIIRLGKGYGSGVRFMAYRLVHEHKNDYSKEFQSMINYNNKIERKRKGLKNRELLRMALLIISVGIAFIPDTVFPNSYVNGVVNRLAIIIPALVAAWIGWQGNRDREKLDKMQELYSVCPNPQCNYQLDKNAQMRLECPKCKCGLH